LTRAEFDRLTAGLVEATMEPMRQAMRDSGLGTGDIAKVLLVGGSSRIPAVQEAVRRFIGKEPSRGVNPDECVAMGAALQAGVLSGEVKDLLLLDVTPLSLGIETMGGVFSKIIERNATIPVRKSQVFTTAANFQASVDIHVLQGEHGMARKNKPLGKFRLSGIKRALRGVPQIEVSFDIDANGIVKVSAKDLGTGKAQDITITASSNLSQSEIDEAIREARIYEAGEGRRKEEARTRHDAEELVNEAQTLLKKLDKDARPLLESAIKAAKTALKGKDSAGIASACRELSSLLETLRSPGPEAGEQAGPECGEGGDSTGKSA
jgi:molecular chaperone DnaK